jgi:hypothetical protein
MNNEGFVVLIFAPPARHDTTRDTERAEANELCLRQDTAHKVYRDSVLLLSQLIIFSFFCVVLCAFRLATVVMTWDRQGHASLLKSS